METSLAESQTDSCFPTDIKQTTVIQRGTNIGLIMTFNRYLKDANLRERWKNNCKCNPEDWKTKSIKWMYGETFYSHQFHKMF